MNNILWGGDPIIKQDILGVIIERKFLDEIFVRNDLSKTDYKVILYLLCVLDMENPYPISQKKIAETLDINKSLVSLSIKSLRGAGIITEIKDRFKPGYVFSFPFEKRSKLEKQMKERILEIKESIFEDD